MIKFFRKIRQKLLAENKFTKYLIYAVGEIVLVVIGILIALYVNNQSNENTNRERINNTLRQIQIDLLNDILEVSQGEENCTFSIDLVDRFLNDSISSFTLSDSINLVYTPFASETIAISNQSYLNLINQMGNVPEDYNEIVFHLNRLYNENANILKRIETDRKRESDFYESLLFRNYNWMVDLRNSNITPEIKDYINTEEFRRQLIKSGYDTRKYKTSLTLFKSQSILCYFIIKDFLEDDSEIPKIIKELDIKYTNDAVEEYLGTYGTESAYRIFQKYDLLFWAFGDENVNFDGLILKEKAQDTLSILVMEEGSYLCFRRDSLNQINGLQINYKNGQENEVTKFYEKQK